MRRKSCKEYAEVVRLCADIIEAAIAVENYVPTSFFQYLIQCQTLAKLVAFLKKMTAVNEYLIADHKDKVERRKKTRRYVPTK